MLSWCIPRKTVRSKPRIRGLPVSSRRGARVHSHHEYSQPIHLERPVLLLTVHSGFVAATPTLEGFKDRYISARHGTTSELTTLFHEQVEQWKKDTQHWSSVTRMIAH